MTSTQYIDESGGKGGGGGITNMPALDQKVLIFMQFSEKLAK